MVQMESTFNSIMNMSAVITVVSVVGGLAVTGIVLFYVFRVIGGLRQQAAVSQAILMNGVPATAKVLQLMDTGTTVNDNPMARLLLEVQMQYQAPYHAQVQMLVPRLKLGQIQPGMNVMVKVDPRDPSKVAVALA
jgi:hypothetical protein